MQICRASKITWPDLLTYVVRKLKTISAQRARKKEQPINKGRVWAVEEQMHLYTKPKPTDDEEYLHCNVTDSRAASQVVIIADEAHVVGDRDGNVEGGEQNQPVPASFEGAVVK